MYRYFARRFLTFALTFILKFFDFLKINEKKCEYLRDFSTAVHTSPLAGLYIFLRWNHPPIGTVTIKGIDKKNNETDESLTVEVKKLISDANSNFDDVDKFHRNGKQVGEKQEIIIRFKSHTAKDVFYKNRKTIPRQGVKVQPSLSAARKKILSEANELLEAYTSEPDIYPNPPEFVFANVHGGLLVKMTKKTKKGMFFKFESTQELYEIIHRCQENKTKVGVTEDGFLYHFKNDTTVVNLPDSNVDTPAAVTTSIGVGSGEK